MSDFIATFWKSFKILKRNFFSSILLSIILIIAFFFFFTIDYFAKKYILIDNIYLFILRLILFFLFIAPLHYGTLLWFIEADKGNKHAFWEALGFYTTIKLLFRCFFHRFIYILICAITLLLTFIFISFSVSAINLALQTAETPYLALAFSFIMVSLSVFFMSCVFLSRWSLSDYIFVTNPDMPIFRTFLLSQKLTKGKKNSLFFFHFMINSICTLTFFILPLSLSLKSLILSHKYTQLYKTKADI